MRSWKVCLFSIVLFYFFSSSLFAQSEADSGKTNITDTPFKKGSLSTLPIIFYSPETRLAFGVAAVYAFRKDSLQYYPSQVQFGLAYTINDQLLLYLPYRLYLNKEKYLLYGEFGYYMYSYNFYGIGNEQDPDYEELYGINFLRIRMSFLRRVQKNLYLGVRYWLEDYKITETEEGMQFASGEIVGSESGLVSGLGLVANYDSRDNLFFPTKGFFVESTFQRYDKAIGSKYEYTRFLIDGSTYLSLAKNHVLAFNGVADFISGNPPFNQMAVLGGTKRMRGFYEGRYRDKNALITQAEYRFPLAGRFGLAAFMAYGAVADEVSNFELNNFRLTGGGGLRFAINRKEHINIRVDYGFGKQSSGLYFTIGEAF